MKRLFTTLLLLLVSISACAADSTTALHYSILKPPVTDYSVGYLGQIFGNVGNVLHGMSGQILGKMFDIFNQGIMIVAAIWLGYTTVTVVMRASNEGSMLGQNRNIAIVFLRIALGFALIIPSSDIWSSSSTGYSILQDFFMKVVVAGVGLADKTWDMALNYLKEGGSLYIAPRALNNDANVVSTALGSSSQPGPISQLLADEYCMLNTHQKNPMIHPKYIAPSNLGASGSPKGGYILFPGANQTDSDVTKTNATCGYIDSYYNQQVSSKKTAIFTKNYSKKQWAQLQMTSWAALKSLTQKMMPVAKHYENNSAPATLMNGTNHESVSQMTFSAMLSYVSLMSMYQHSLVNKVSTPVKPAPMCTRNFEYKNNQGQWVEGPPGCVKESAAVHAEKMRAYENQVALAAQQNNANGVDKFIPKAKAQGWIMAGRFYWDVEQLNQDADAVSISQLFPTAYAQGTGASGSNAGASQISALLGKQTEIANLWSQYVGVQQNTVTSKNASSSQAISTGSVSPMAEALIGSGVSDLSSVQSDFSISSNNNNQSYNPISVLMKEGTHLLKIVVDMWIAAITASGLAFLATGFCSSVSSLPFALKSVLSWVKPALTALWFLLLMPGAILAYYVPLYPFLVFTFAAIGWFLMVIEGMAAAPLVCLGLTHPDGHDSFLGKAEQALMLFLGVFVRPVLMVIGLIGAMLISFVAFHMMIVGFSGLMGDLSHASGSPLRSGLLSLINFCLIMVIFGMLVMEVVEQSFKLVYQLPNNIMRWIGGPQMGEEYGQMAKALQQGVGTAAGDAGAKLGNAAANFADGGNGTAAEKQRHTQGLKDKQNAQKPGNVINTGGGSI